MTCNLTYFTSKHYTIPLYFMRAEKNVFAVTTVDGCNSRVILFHGGGTYMPLVPALRRQRQADFSV